jgi:predicted P-loop ATPase
MTVLEGPQGSGKSSVVQILGGQFAGTLFLDPHQKDTIMNMRHNWINEIAEMEFTRKADIAAVKHFISNRADTLRMPYGHSSATYKRQCIFIGSINPDADGGYLRDTTGNRRFWPVKTEKINLAGLKAVRDQLFAEAKTRYFKKEAWFMNTPELLKLAELEQETRREIHPWAEVIARHLKTRKKQGESNRIIYPSSLAVAALGLTPASLDIQSIKTIGNILQVFGYKAVRTRGSLHYVKNDAGLEDLW